MRVTFEDDGQDFLVWKLNAAGVVTGCGPFQGWVWIGATVHEHQRIRRGQYITITPKGGGVAMTLVHRVAAVRAR